jgi:beta-mannosidase
MRTLLHDGWTVRAAGPTETVAPATVPGCVHTDLLAAGLIPDPYLDQNEAALAWIGETGWRYETSFDWQPTGDDRVDLVCDGLDTVATVELNGVVVGETRNMHRGYRFDVRDAIRPGANRLVVVFESAIAYAKQLREKLGPLPGGDRFPYNFIRKMACNFGWDWGPELVTAGIWKPIALESWSTARLASVRPLATVDGATGRLAVHVELERTSDAEVPVVVRIADQVIETSVQKEGIIEVVVDDVRLWWPRGYGEQPLYPLQVEVSGETWEAEIGFRTVRLDTTPDEIGTPFTFIVNDVPVFARGVNWIPDDCFPHRVTRDRYERRLTQAADAGVNLLRVWGGGIFESDDFYQLCDRMGLLTWQDFLFACAAYPEEEPIRAEVIAEAREAITRLSSHPSLVLWNGNNENIWGYYDWNWQPQLGDRTWGLGYYLDILPKLVAELDPTRPYCAASPWSFSQEIHPNDPDHGCMHIWDVWNQRDYTGYLDYIPRFASEFGFQGPPRWSTLTRAVHDTPLAVDGPALLAHQKAADGMGKLERSLVQHFPAPANFDDWFWGTQLNQARALTLGIEHFRSWSPRCGGTVVWQLNDCWPVTSWAVIDGDGGLKPAWYALKHAYADRLVTIQARDGGLAVVVVNDTADAYDETISVRRMTFGGEVLAQEEIAINASGRSTVTVELPEKVRNAADPRAEFLVVHTTTGRAYWYFLPDKDLAMPAERYEVNSSTTPTGYRVAVTARSFLRDVAVLADRIASDAEVDDMLVTLLPGETATFEVRTSASFDPAALTSATVVRTANQLLLSDR